MNCIHLKETQVNLREDPLPTKKTTRRKEAGQGAKQGIKRRCLIFTITENCFFSTTIDYLFAECCNKRNKPLPVNKKKRKKEDDQKANQGIQRRGLIFAISVNFLFLTFVDYMICRKLEEERNQCEQEKKGKRGWLAGMPRNPQKWKLWERATLTPLKKNKAACNKVIMGEHYKVGESSDRAK